MIILKLEIRMPFYIHSPTELVALTSREHVVDAEDLSITVAGHQGSSDLFSFSTQI